MRTVHSCSYLSAYKVQVLIRAISGMQTLEILVGRKHRDYYSGISTVEVTSMTQ